MKKANLVTGLKLLAVSAAMLLSPLAQAQDNQSAKDPIAKNAQTLHEFGLSKVYAAFGQTQALLGACSWAKPLVKLSVTDYHDFINQLSKANSIKSSELVQGSTAYTEALEKAQKDLRAQDPKVVAGACDAQAQFIQDKSGLTTSKFVARIRANHYQDSYAQQVDDELVGSVVQGLGHSLLSDPVLIQKP